MRRAVAHVFLVKHAPAKAQPELQRINIGPVFVFQRERRAGHVVIGFE